MIAVMNNLPELIMGLIFGAVMFMGGWKLKGFKDRITAKKQ